MIELGKEVADKVSGFQGIAPSRCEYLNGCIQYGVTPKVVIDGKYPDTQYLDENQIEIIGDGVEVESKKTGGPQFNAPPR